jgi:ribonucleotide reductase alpha subunit
MRFINTQMKKRRRYVHLSSMVLKNFVKSVISLILKNFSSEVRKVVRALNKVVDINNYSTEKGRKGGMEQRAIAIGTQGLADVFYLMDYIFTSDDAKKLNRDIFETIYYAAVYESNQLCKERTIPTI